MYSIDQDVDTRVWALIIRARQQFEVDALIASMVAHAVAQVGSHQRALVVARVASEATRHLDEKTEAPVERRMAMLELVADWDGDLCPAYWHGPRPHHDGLGDIDDAMTSVVLARAATLVEVAGSEQLRGTLGVALHGGACER